MKEVIAHLIKTKRQAQGMTQRALAQGICTQAVISKIEKGTVMPSVELFAKLSSRLALSQEEINQLFHVRNLAQQTIFNQEMRRILEQRDYKALEVVLNRLDPTQLAGDDVYYYQWLQAVNDYSLSQDVESYRSRLMKLLDQVAGLPALYCQVLASIGLLNMDLEAYQVARSYYETILVRLDSLEDCRFKMRVYYRLAEICLAMNDQEAAYHYYSEALEVAKAAESFYLLGLTYLGLTKLLENQAMIEEARTACQKALQVFELEGAESGANQARWVLNRLKNQN